MLSVAIDSETTGIDLHHSCRPFLIQLCSSDSPEAPLYWKWKVDPLTRKPNVIREDIAEIVDWLDRADEIIFHHAKFDIRALVSVGLKWKASWWPKVQDTLFSGHLLQSSLPRNLTDQVLFFLGIDIQPLEERLGKVINECRTIVRREYSTWKIAELGENKQPPIGMPSLKGADSLWKWDLWLGEVIADKRKLPEDHEYRTATLDYALGDVVTTLSLWLEHKRLLEERDLIPLYNERRKLIRIIYEMENRGVTVSRSRLDEMHGRLSEEAAEANILCESISKRMGFDVKLPKSGTNNSLLAFAEAKNGLNMPELLGEKANPALDGGGGRSKAVNKKGIRTPTGRLSLTDVNREACLFKLERIEPHGGRRRFIANWSRKQKRETACGFMASYTPKRFGILIDAEDYIWLHPSINATGTGTLRMSSERPNEQNVSKQGEVNIRYCFGPRKGREWWALDFENLELRIPAYEAQEEEMIALFERPNDPPYFGSQHLLIAHILWQREFEECLRKGESFKDKYKASLYQWTKNGNFAVTYGAIEESGTADAAYHQEGAQRKIKSRFRKLAQLNDYYVESATRTGMVHTMVDKELGVGYPLQIPRSDWGKIIPTTPLNYHVQGTAMWCTCRSMVRCDTFLEQWNRSAEGIKRIQDSVIYGAKVRAGAFTTMQVHDELCFDFPRGETPNANLPAVMELKRLMGQAGEDIGVPLSVDVSYHPDNWAKSVKVEELIAA